MSASSMPPQSSNGRFPPEARALGEPTHIYKLSRRVFRRECGRGYAYVIAGLLAVGAGIRIGQDGVWWAALLGILFGLALGYMGVMHLLVIYRERGVITLVARNGLVRLKRHGATLVRWRDIERIRVEWLHNRQTRVYILFLKHNRGQYHYFDVTPNAVIGETIQYRHAREWLPKLIARFDEGEAIQFQRVRLDQQGVHLNGQTLVWENIHRFERRNGQINAFVQDRWHTIATVTEIDNPLILLGMMEHVHKTRKYRKVS